MKKFKLALYTLLALTTFNAKAQTFSTFGGLIPDDGTNVRFNIPVTGLPTSIDSSFGLESVCINLIHPYTSDLHIFLVAPDSTYIELTTENGGSGDNYWNTCFVDTVPNFITNGNAPFTGDFRPESPLYNVNNGQDPNQTWQLLIEDVYPFADAGFLSTVSITFGNHPGQGITLQSSNLPIIKINTVGQIIPDDPKISARMMIIDNGPGVRNYSSDTATIYNGYIGIELRGSSSQGFPKKSYGLETQDSLGGDLDTSLFGLPSESDWILNANYTDKTLMRNVLSYDLSRGMGHYASRHQYCELLINGQYQGVYIFMEKIKRDQSRVDIAKLTTADTTGDDLTGGYILKIGKSTGSSGPGFTSPYSPPFGGPPHTMQFEYPEYDEILPVQASYIEQYCDSFENALFGPQYADPLTGYRKYVDLGSWVDYFLLNELSKNVDGYRISTYFFKQKDSDGGLLHMGPVWDYDIAWGNADYYGGDVSSGYSYIFNHPGDGNQVPFWWYKLMQDTYFKNTVRCRWEELRDSLLTTANLHNWIDSVGNYLDESQARNFNMWPILGVYVWPNPSPIPPDYAGVKQELKDWITNRATWLDTFLPGNCSLTGIDETAVYTNVTAYPNPAGDDTWILLPEEIHGTTTLRIYDAPGRLLYTEQRTVHEHRIPVDLKGYQTGILLIEAEHQGKVYRTKVMKR